MADLDSQTSMNRAETGALEVAFVRKELAPAMAPPVNESGVLGWMRKNLFLNIPNTILTLFAGYILYLTIPGLIQWIFTDAVWSGDDRLACATVAQGGELPEGWKAACWPYVGAYLKLFIYGRYPDAELWRVNIVLFMFFAGLVPLLMPNVPFKRENLIFMLGIFPVASFVLLSGGNLDYSGFLTMLFVIFFIIASIIFIVPQLLTKFSAKNKKSEISIMQYYLAFSFFGIYILLKTYNVIFSIIYSLLSYIGASTEGVYIGNPVYRILRYIDSKTNFLFSGSFWVDYIVLSLAVVGIVALYFKSTDSDVKKPAQITAIAMGVLALVLFVMSVDFGLEPVETDLWGGFVMTLVIAVTGIVAALPLGILLALGRRSNMPAVSLFSVIFIEFWRGIPLITVLFMSSVMLPLFLPDGVTFDKLLRALIGVALFSSAYMAEVVRGGLQALPKGQYEGAMAVGLNYWQSMRLIIMPQALKIVIPGIVNTFIGLFKDTTLVSIIGLLDFLGMINLSHSDATWATPVQAMTSYVFCAFIFFIFCFGMSRYSIYMEDRLNTSHR